MHENHMCVILAHLISYYYAIFMHCTYLRADDGGDRDGMVAPPPYCNFNVLRGLSLTHSLTHSLTVCVPVCVHVSPCLFVCVLFVRGCARNSHHQISELLPADSCPHTTARSSTTAPSSRAAGSCRPTFRGIIRGKPYVITAWLHLCNIFCQ